MDADEDFEATLEGLSATELMNKKDSIESEIKEFMDLLESQQGVGMQGPLVDREGYPRSDIDIYSVRVARNRIICLRNDHKKVMARIEETIHQLHKEAREQQLSSQSSQPDNEAPPTRNVSVEMGFARVSIVTQGSPAAAAGLLEGDVITEFGSVRKSTFSNLQDIARVVQHSQGRTVRVEVVRGNQLKALSLVPKPWSGHGLLGCHINAL